MLISVVSMLIGNCCGVMIVWVSVLVSMSSELFVSIEVGSSRC